MDTMKMLNTLADLAWHKEKVANARLVAAITVGNRVISLGNNKKKSHPFQAKYGKNEDCIYLHAEIDAIKNFLQSEKQEALLKSTMYVCRVKKCGDDLVWGLSKPCTGCCRAIATFGIKNVIYTTDNRSFTYL